VFIFLGHFFSFIMTLATAASDMISFGSMVYVQLSLWLALVYLEEMVISMSPMLVMQNRLSRVYSIARVRIW
jgi:hypothetical protein